MSKNRRTPARMGILTVINELNHRKIETSLYEISRLAKKRQLAYFNKEELLESLTSLIKSGELLQVKKRNHTETYHLVSDILKSNGEKSTIDGYDEVKYDGYDNDGSIGVNDANENQNFKSEVLEVVNNLHESMLYFKEHVQQQLDGLTWNQDNRERKVREEELLKQISEPKLEKN